MALKNGKKAATTEQEPAVPHAMDSIEELQARMVETHERGEAIRATADAEQRMLTEDETTQLDQLSEQFEQLDAEVKRRERLAAQRERLAQPQKRVTQPGETVAAESRPRIEGGDYAGVSSKHAWGWRSMGEFAKGCVAAARGQIDPRLVAAATTYGNEATQADGGFAVPPDFRDTIVKKIEGEDSLLARTDQQFTSSNKLTVPLDNTTPWQTSGGIQAYWESEAATYTQSKPKLDQLEVKANKLTALVPMTDELLEDVPSLTRYLPGKVAEKFTSKLNDALISGDGVGKLQGLMSSPSKVAVAKEVGQTADTINFTNIIKMWSRLYARLRGGAVWLVNQDCEPQLLSLVVPGTQPSYPAYLPPGGLSASPYATLLGRPVIPVEAAATVGDEGDIILTNLQSYLTVQKVGGIRQDVSIHLYFDQSVTAFRFVMRCGGQSWWNAAASRLKGSNTLTNIVTLAERT